MEIKEGATYTWSRIFSKNDVIEFSRISGDRGIHHVQPDSKGRLVVQGLLTATLATKLGGDINYLARTMNNEFLRPVHTGERITCSITLNKIEPREKYQKIQMSAIYHNPDNEIVLMMSSFGIIRYPHIDLS